MRKVEIFPYSAQWPEKFLIEQLLLKAIAPGLITEIHHIGSTSVPGLPAKPIIDILMVVTHIIHLDNFNASFEAIGYEVMGEFGIEGRRYFRKGGLERSHHIHAFEQGSADIERHLAFRDYLRNNAELRDNYAAVKKQAAIICNHDIEIYMDEKNDFIQETQIQALNWMHLKEKKIQEQ